MRTHASTTSGPASRGGEDGFAVPAVLLMVLAAFAFVSVGVVASIQAQSGTTRDQGSKGALATAEAGVTQALLTYNGGFATTSAAPCLIPVTNPANSVQPRAALASGWCSATPPASDGGGGTFTYQVCPYTAATPCAGSGTIEIVSTGTNNGVTRRVDVVAKSVSGQQFFIDAGMKTQTNLIMDSNSVVHSPTQAGGSITMGSTSTMLCGGATVGPTGTATGSGQYYPNSDCTGGRQSLSTVGHQALTLPPVNQGNAASVNDNCRITAATTGAASCVGGDYRDLISGSASNVSWNPSTRQLAITGQSTSLTLTGRTYSFCKLTMTQNSALYIDPGQTNTVNVFFDDPASCGPLAAYNATSATTQKATGQLYMESNTRITQGSGALGMYFVGSQTIPTGIVMSSNAAQNQPCVQNFVVYAPLSQVEMNSNSTFCGAIAAYSVHLDQNAVFTTDNPSRSIVLPGTPPHYVVTRFLDCTPTTSGSPNSGC